MKFKVKQRVPRALQNLLNKTEYNKNIPLSDYPYKNKPVVEIKINKCNNCKKFYNTAHYKIVCPHCFILLKGK